MTFPDITLAIDRITFRVTGMAPQQFLNLATQQNLRLWRIRCREGGGYTAMARGVDLPALRAIAVRGGWQFVLLHRRGPGPWVARALRRPGIPVGLLLFLVLLRFLSGYIWCVDFGALSTEEQTSLRTMLTENGIYEGARPSVDILATARRKAATQTDLYGWISINFTAGCLAIESSPSQFESITPSVAEAALYATTEGKVLRVETKSGFALVTPGQYVATGQLLVDCSRTRRSGTTFTQGASGAVVARIERSYTATQPATVTTAVPGTVQAESFTLYCLGAVRRPVGENSDSNPCFVEWLPLHIGRVALPGCLVRTTRRPQQNVTLHYTAAQTAALAARACRQQLMAEFPDAVIEMQQRTDKTTENGTRCTLRYTFCANIAQQK